jgi:hypothetical protein
MFEADVLPPFVKEIDPIIKSCDSCHYTVFVNGVVTETNLGFNPKGSRAERIREILAFAGSKRTAIRRTEGSARIWITPSRD